MRKRPRIRAGWWPIVGFNWTSHRREFHLYLLFVSITYYAEWTAKQKGIVI